ncbi:MAG: hypothetical protein MJ237_04695 [bacterium]|nr:hypothetical protein [bacterium]
MVSANYGNYEKNYFASGTKVIQTAPIPLQSTNDNSNIKSVPQQLPSFRAGSYTSTVTVKTELTTKEEKEKYKELSEALDGKYRRKLEYALKSGILLKNESSDKSSVLDNIHKILKDERDQGLDNITLIKECLDIIDNPYVITQTCEDIPNEYKKPVLGIITNLSEDREVLENTNKYLNELHTGTCPAASIEFDLATRQPAEFFRIVEGLTSPKNEAYKTIKLDALNEKTEVALWLLETFKTPYVAVDMNSAIVRLKPDKNAIIRARIQNNHRDKGERSIIDVLMQSTMMQLGSQQTYDSLIDKRAPNDFTEEDGGLIDMEKTYVESIMENKNTTSVIYQNVDESGKLTGYNKPTDAIKKDLIDTLAMGYNVIIGYTWPDPDNDNKLAGHEITIVGTKTSSNGETIFICQDSDDELDKPIEMPESFLLTHIHHAGLPDFIASRDTNYGESWEYVMDDYESHTK